MAYFMDLENLIKGLLKDVEVGLRGLTKIIKHQGNINRREPLASPGPTGV